MTYRTFYCSAIVCGLCYATFLLFNTLGPFIIQKDLGYGVRDYGNFALWMGGAYFLGILLNQISRTVQSRVKTSGLIGLMCSVAVISLISALWLPGNLYLVLIPSGLMIFGAGILFPKLYAQCLSQFKDKSGIVSAALGGYFLLIASFCSVAFSFGRSFGWTGLLEMMGSYCLISLVIMVFYWGGLKLN